jgi:PEP-CTERM motif
MKLLRNHTKQSAKTLLVFGFTSLIAATTLFGQIAIAFDEWGIATGIPHGFTGTDPSGGVVGVPVLMYTLPFGVVPGDLLLTEEPGANQNQYSDVVRFWNPTGGNQQSLIIFYSERPEDPLEIPPPADIGLPSQLQSSVIGPFPEIGTDAFNFYDYTAVLFMPGSGATGAIHYHIISDVPEPNTCSLVVLGSGLLFVLKRRFQSNRK